MQQKVDFLEFLPKEVKVFLSLNKIASTAIIVTGLLVALMVVNFWQNQQLKSSVKKAQQAEATASQQLLTLTRKSKDSSKIKALKTRVNQLSGEVEGQKNILRLYKEKQVALSDGFAQELQALAENTLEGAWLTQFNLRSGQNRAMQLKGEALSTQDAVRYLDTLKKAKRLTGWRFELGSLRQASVDGKSVTLFDLKAIYE